MRRERRKCACYIGHPYSLVVALVGHSELGSSCSAVYTFRVMS